MERMQEKMSKESTNIFLVFYTGVKHLKASHKQAQAGWDSQDVQTIGT
jgi:hypothetical protein